MKLKNLVLVIIIVVLLLTIGFLLNKQYNWVGENKNVAVYLSTGELYFGQKTGLTGFKLKNAWLLNKGEDGKYSLQEFSQAAWKPVGTLHIVKDKIVFWTNVDEDSDITKLINGEKKSSDVQSTTTTTPSTDFSTSPTTQK